MKRTPKKPTDLLPLEFVPTRIGMRADMFAKLVGELREAGLAIYSIAGKEYVSESQWRRLLGRIAVEVAT